MTEYNLTYVQAQELLEAGQVLLMKNRKSIENKVRLNDKGKFERYDPKSEEWIEYKVTNISAICAKYAII